MDWRKKGAMSTRTVCFVAALLSLSPLAHAQPKDASAGRVEIREDKERLHITVNGKQFADYVFEGYSRPFLFPLLGPGGVKMTRNYPLAQGENEETDHPHHKSFWWGHGDMNGVDFWAEGRNSGKVVHQEFTKIASGSTGTIGSKNKYVDQDGKIVCTDERTLRIYPTAPGEKGQLFDFNITIHASNGDLKFGDTKEGTMALRLAETMRLAHKDKTRPKGHIVNSEGVTDDKTWGKRAKWVDYYGPVGDKTVGIAIFDHPKNPRHPTWWHVRDYGLFAANPFGVHDFEKKPAGAGDLTVRAGDKITFKYRFYIHAGDEKEAKVKEAYAQYIQEPDVVLNDQANPK